MQYDVYANPIADGYLLDCQSNELRDLETRVLLPLLPARLAPKRRAGPLHPVFEIAGEAHVLATHLPLAVASHHLGRPVTSLEDRRHLITNAIDYLLTGV